MTPIRAVAVFCGANPGHDPAYRAAAVALGRGLAQAEMRLVYGGGGVGLMAAVADGALDAGGHVTGVIPDFLTRRELAHPRVADLVVTATMHARKQRMFELADAFVTMPGGLGTLDETFEILTWRQLGLHAKPLVLCDVLGSAAALLGLVDAMAAAGFVRPEHRAMISVGDGVAGTLALLTGGGTDRDASVGRM